VNKLLRHVLDDVANEVKAANAAWRKDFDANFDAFKLHATEHKDGSVFCVIDTNTNLDPECGHDFMDGLKELMDTEGYLDTMSPVQVQFRPVHARARTFSFWLTVPKLNESVELLNSIARKLVRRFDHIEDDRFDEKGKARPYSIKIEQAGSTFIVHFVAKDATMFGDLFRAIDRFKEVVYDYNSRNILHVQVEDGDTMKPPSLELRLMD